VRDKNNGLPGRLPDPEQFILQPLASLSIHRGKRLIHKKDLGIIRQGTGNGHALLHPPRKFMGKPIGKSVQSHQSNEVITDRLAFTLGNFLDLQSEFDVLANRSPGKKCIPLKHNPPVKGGSGHFFSVNMHGSGCGICQTGKNIQKRGLAAPRGPDHHKKLTLPYFKVDIPESNKLFRRLVSTLLQVEDSG